MADNASDRSSSPVLEWIEAVSKSFAPVALITVMGAGLLFWREFAVMDNRVKALEDQANKGSRFTAADGARQQAQIDLVYSLQRAHEDKLHQHMQRGEAGFEKIRQLEKEMEKCEQRCR